MKNITVSLDDDTYRRARVYAAEQDTSVSALVREYLNGLPSAETRFEAMARQERELRAHMDREGIGVSAANRLKRDELYERR